MIYRQPCFHRFVSLSRHVLLLLPLVHFLRNPCQIPKEAANFFSISSLLTTPDPPATSWTIFILSMNCPGDFDAYFLAFQFLLPMNITLDILFLYK